MADLLIVTNLYA